MFGAGMKGLFGLTKNSITAPLAQTFGILGEVALGTALVNAVRSNNKPQNNLG